MRSYFVMCIMLAMVGVILAGLAGRPLSSGCSFPRPGLPGEKGRSRNSRLPPGPVPPTTEKYCRVSSQITTFLKQFRIRKDRGAAGATGKIGYDGRKGRHGSSDWVYNCLHAGLNLQDRVFELPIYQCCQKCEFPRFSQCMRSYPTTVAQFRCNSEALRCIAQCICKKGSGGTTGQPGRPGQRPGVIGRPGPTAPPQKCPVKRKKIGSSYCLERSCIGV